jgi:hypothetical protein
MKLSSIQIAIGKLNTQCTKAMPIGELTNPERANKINPHFPSNSLISLS